MRRKPASHDRSDVIWAKKTGTYAYTLLLYTGGKY